MNTPLTLLVLLAFSTFLPYARAADFPSPACSVPEPTPISTPNADPGIDLGDIIKFDVGATAAFTASVEPTVQLNFDFEDRFVNLTPGPEGPNLVFAESRNGYEALDRRRIEGGLGAQLAFQFGNSTMLAPALWASVGLMPVGGGGVETLRFFSNRATLDDRANPPQASEALAALEKLQPHDALRYDAEGGLVFWVGAGYGIVGDAAIAALAKGGFDVNIEKVDADHAHVMITEANLKALGIQAGNLLTNVSVSQFSRYAGTLSFLINFHDPLGKKALHDLVYGNVAPVQKLAAVPGSPVSFLDKAEANRLGLGIRFTVGEPSILGWSWGRSRYFEALRRRDYACGRNLRATYGAFVQREVGGVFGIEEETTKAFYGVSYSLQDSAEKTAMARGYLGELVWGWRGRKVLPRSFRDAMVDLAADTGLGNALVLTVPDSVRNRLDFSALTLRVRFRASHVLRLLEHSRDLARAGTSQGLTKMQAALQEMSLALKTGKEKAATQAFARFGEAMLTDPVTLKAGLTLAGSDLPVDYVVEGSDFFRHVSLAKADDRGFLAPDQRPPLVDPFHNPGWEGGDSLIVTPMK
ncbi:MAG: hypothetical protein ACXVCI_10775 [Bdellovibrionota bacterium]